MNTTNRRRVIEGGIVRQLSDPYKGVYYAPLGVYMGRDGLHLVIDPEAPHWLSTNEVYPGVPRLIMPRAPSTPLRYLTSSHA